jgi:hypothetical protein
MHAHPFRWTAAVRGRPGVGKCAPQLAVVEVDPEHVAQAAKTGRNVHPGVHPNGVNGPNQ